MLASRRGGWPGDREQGAGVDDRDRLLLLGRRGLDQSESGGGEGERGDGGEQAGGLHDCPSLFVARQEPRRSMSQPLPPAHPEEGLSLAKARLEVASETPFRQAQRLLRMSGGVSAGGSERHLDRVDDEADQAADQGAVDPDILEVAADRAFEPVGDGARVPGADRVRDQRDDAVAIGGDRADRGAAGELVDRRLEPRLAAAASRRAGAAPRRTCRPAPRRDRARP